MWSHAHWKQSSTGSDGGDGGCSNVLHPIIPVGAWMDPRAEKERLVTVHLFSRFRIAHVHFALDFLETASLVLHVV